MRAAVAVGIGLSGVLTLALAKPCIAQDPVAVDPEHHKVEFENDQVRVLRIVFPPGSRSVMHEHPCLIAIGLGDSTLTFHMPDGSTRDAPMKRGQVVVVKAPFAHEPENRGNAASEVIVVELKTGCAASSR
jgi:quercetin dioxygenase-like cupin family protein